MVQGLKVQVSLHCKKIPSFEKIESPKNPVQSLVEISTGGLKKKIFKSHPGKKATLFIYTDLRPIQPMMLKLTKQLWRR